MNDNNVVMQIEGLCKTYGSHEVLKDISLTINKGDVIAVIGPSGCGKSTFIRMLNLLERPTSGKIHFDGMELTSLPQNTLIDITPKIGMLFQPFNLFQNLTVKQNITLSPVLHRIYTQKEADEWALQMLERVGLAEHADKYPSQLSGGQQQRVSIARALCMNPKILFFDEPTSALDPELTQDILKVIKDLAAEHMTMVIVTHEMKFARNVADHVIFMENGVVVDQGEAKLLFDNPSDRLKEFLGKYEE